MLRGPKAPTQVVIVARVERICIRWDLHAPREIAVSLVWEPCHRAPATPRIRPPRPLVTRRTAHSPAAGERVFFSNRLRDTHLQPPYLLVHPLPVDSGPLEGRGCASCSRSRPSLSPSKPVLQTLSRRITCWTWAPFRAGHRSRIRLTARRHSLLPASSPAQPSDSLAVLLPFRATGRGFHVPLYKYSRG
jgi:hypothetical protein